MAGTDDEEHRHQHRQRVLKGATILTGVSRSEISCRIRNMHSEGAEIEVAEDSPVPREFLLYVPNDGVAYRSVLTWRKGKRAGLTFNGTAPKPHWHYG